MNAHNSIRRCFERGSRLYDDNTPVQKEIAELLLARALDSRAVTEERCRILELGCGTGTLTGMLCEIFPSAAVHALDISENMLSVAKARCNASNISWICGDMSGFDDAEGFDYIFSSSSVHWVGDQKRIFARLNRLLKPGGRLIISTMGEGTFAELHESRRQVLPHKLPSRQLLPHTRLLGLIQNAGFRVLHESEEKFQQVFPGVSEFLKSMRASGLTGGDLSHDDRLLTRGELSKLIARYEQLHANPQGEVPVTYQVSFVSAVVAEQAECNPN